MTNIAEIVRLQIEGRDIRIIWNDRCESVFDSYWLHGNCPLGGFVVENSSQKLCDAVDLPDGLAPEST